MKTMKSLGLSIDYPDKYNPGLLEAMERRSNDIQCYGWDVWNAYEVSWLNNQDIPENRMISFSLKNTTPFIPESKSVKLYLNSLNMQKFESELDVVNVIKHDIETCLKTKLFNFEIINDGIGVLEYPHSYFDIFSAKPIEIESLLTHSNEWHHNHASYVTHRFRSCCPVTGQPDWATLFIELQGTYTIGAMYSILKQYRNHSGFHESCIQDIFESLWNSFDLDKLTIIGRFLRRGGIDINPIRSTEASIEAFNIRTRFQ